MADRLYQVELTASFLARLDAIEVFLVEADAGFAFDDLLAIRHHRQLSFDFARLWPGDSLPDPH